MSHFTVLVINTDGSTDVEAPLAPFQENNMGDCPEEYMEFNDQQDEFETEFNDDTCEQVKLPNGSFVFSWSNEAKEAFPDEEERKSNIVTRKFSEVYDSFEEFCEDYHGHDGVDKKTGRYGYWENPNAKWDWYEVGGRWAGSLKIKEEFRSEYEGTPLGFSWGWDDEQKAIKRAQLVSDSALAKHVDWDAYMNKEDYDRHCRFWELIVEGQEPQNEKEEEQVKFNFYRPEYFSNKYPNKGTYAQAQCAFSTYAVLKDGEWIAKGEMGWFGMSSESSEDGKQFELSFHDNFIKDLPEDAFLCVVDCHI